MRYLLLLISFCFLFSAEIIVKYPNLQESYYQNQTVNLGIHIVTPQNLHLKFIPPRGSKIKVKTKNHLIYDVNLTYINDRAPKKFIIKGNGVYKKINLKNMYETLKVNKIKGYCNVVADDLNVTNPIATKYNDKENMLSFTLMAKNANLRSFTLALKDENLTINSPKKATFFALVDNKVKKINFYYFNPQKGTYTKVTFPVKLKEETISTQTELNPEESTFFTPLNIFILVLIAIFLILFLMYRQIWILIFPIIISLFLVYLNLPKGEILLKKGTKVYILPTKNSTVFYTAPINTEVKVLKRVNNYTKVKINDKIGWVRDEDIK